MLVKVTEDKNGKQLVSARELHKYLEVKRDFTTWIKGRIERLNFKENLDFTVSESFHQNGGKGGRPQKDYIITLYMAKCLAMMEKNQKGDEVRDYFIKCEEQLKKESDLRIKNGTKLKMIASHLKEIERLEGEYHETAKMIAENYKRIKELSDMALDEYLPLRKIK